MRHYLSYKILGVENQNRPVPDSKKSHLLFSLALENFAPLIVSYHLFFSEIFRPLNIFRVIFRTLNIFAKNFAPQPGIGT